MWQIAAASSVLFAALSLPEFSLAQTKPKQIFALVFCFGPLIAKAAPALAGSLSLCFFYLLPGTKTKRNQPQAKPLPPPFAFLLQLAVCMLISYLIYSGLWIAAV